MRLEHSVTASETQEAEPRAGSVAAFRHLLRHMEEGRQAAENLLASRGCGEDPITHRFDRQPRGDGEVIHRWH